MVKINGAAALDRRLKTIPRRAQTNVDKALFVTAQNIEADARVSITRGSISGAGHVPSRPGQPPKNDTGNLKNNIVARRIRRLKYRITSGADYAAFLEFGTRRIRARPYMQPAAEKNRKALRRNVVKAIRRALQ